MGYATLTIAAGVPFHDAGAVADHEPAGGLLLDRDCERGVGRLRIMNPPPDFSSIATSNTARARASERQIARVPYRSPLNYSLDVKVEAGRPRCCRSSMVVSGGMITAARMASGLHAARSTQRSVVVAIAYVERDQLAALMSKARHSAIKDLSWCKLTAGSISGVGEQPARAKS